MGRGLVAVTALLFFASASLTGCSWTATIARTDDLDNEAEIEHSDAEALYLRDRRGRIHRVERDSVRGIDHPGNVEVLVGAILMAFTVLVARDLSDEGKSITPVVLIWGGPAGALVLSGMGRYVASLRAAWAFQFADPPPKSLVPDGPSPETKAAPANRPLTPPPAPQQIAPPPAPPPAPERDDEQPEVIPDAT